MGCHCIPANCAKREMVTFATASYGSILKTNVLVCLKSQWATAFQTLFRYSAHARAPASLR